MTLPSLQPWKILVSCVRRETGGAVAVTKAWGCHCCLAHTVWDCQSVVFKSIGFDFLFFFLSGFQNGLSKSGMPHGYETQKEFMLLFLYAWDQDCILSGWSPGHRTNACIDCWVQSIPAVHELGGINMAVERGKCSGGRKFRKLNL